MSESLTGRTDIGTTPAGEQARENLRAIVAEHGAEISCRCCGCAEYRACEGGCWWVPDPEGLGALCSTCLPLLEVSRAD